VYVIRFAIETVAPSEISHAAAYFFCFPSISLSSSNTRVQAIVIPSTGDFRQAVDLVKALIACHVFSVAGRPVAGDSLARVKGALTCLLTDLFHGAESFLRS